MSERRPVSPRQARAGQGRTGSAREIPRRARFLDRLRTQERETLRARAPSRARAGRARRRLRLSPWQAISITVMLLLGLALILSTFLPYLPGFL